MTLVTKDTSQPPRIKNRSELKNPLILYGAFVGVSLMLLGAATAASLMV